VGELFTVKAIKFTGAVPGAMTKREFRNEILKPAWKELGEWFHKNLLPIRFTNAAKQLLNLAPRGGEAPGTSYKAFRRSYTGRKVRMKGHRKPFVWSGTSERNATKIRDVRATSNGTRIVLHAPALNFRNKHSAIRMNEEIRRVAESEYPILQRRFERIIQERIKADDKARKFKGF